MAYPVSGMDIGLWQGGQERAVFPAVHGPIVEIALSTKGLCFFPLSFLIAARSFVSLFTTMPSFDAHAFGLLIALAVATVALVISIRVVPVVRVVLVRNTPTRARRR